VPDSGYPEIPEGALLLLPNLLPLEYLFVLLGLRCSPEVSGGTKKQNRKHHKFVFPIKGSKKLAARHRYCPWFHPQFVNGSGCYRYIRVDVDETTRGKIDYGSESFKRDFNRRSSSERIFSRLLSILMQEPTVRCLTATANLCTITHITVLAVSYFASFVK